MAGAFIGLGFCIFLVLGFAVVLLYNWYKS